MTQITYKRLSNIVKYFMYLAIIYIITFSCVACGRTSKSGQLAKQPLEKIVIIDSFSEKIIVNNTQQMYKYKVKRISKGVVTVIYEYDLYEQGDTILHRFPQ